jgi:hypothetical protein
MEALMVVPRRVEVAWGDVDDEPNEKIAPRFLEDMCPQLVRGGALDGLLSRVEADALRLQDLRRLKSAAFETDMRGCAMRVRAGYTLLTRLAVTSPAIVTATASHAGSHPLFITAVKAVERAVDPIAQRMAAELVFLTAANEDAQKLLELVGVGPALPVLQSRGLADFVE